MPRYIAGPLALSSGESNLENCTESPSPQTVPHPEYYKDGGDLWILASPTYFRVHSSFFIEGTNYKFFEKKTTPAGSQLDRTLPLPGTIQKNAIIITKEEATVEEFALLLWVIYNPLYDDYSKASLSDWFVILRLATEFCFTGIQAMALRYISAKVHEIPDLVDRICKYEQYSPPVETLLPLYVNLCTREDALNDEEWDKLEQLKHRRARKVNLAREKVIKAGESGNATSIVAEVFGFEGKSTAQASRPTATAFSGSVEEFPSDGSAVNQTFGALSLSEPRNAAQKKQGGGKRDKGRNGVFGDW